jgi:hypothetical protein
MTTPTTPQKHILQIEMIGDRRWKQWAKALTGVDCSKSNGYAFEGQFINEGTRELPVGTLVLYFGECGSRSRRTVDVCVTRIDPTSNTGERQVFYVDELPQNGWSLHVRDRIAKLFEQPEPEQPTEQSAESNPFDQFSDEQILAEAKRRGII